MLSPQKNFQKIGENSAKIKKKFIIKKVIIARLSPFSKIISHMCGHPDKALSLIQRDDIRDNIKHVIDQVCKCGL